MAQQQNGLGRVATEIDLQVAAKLLLPVETDLSAKLRKLLRDSFGHAIDGGFVVAGRFDFNQIADGRNHRFSAFAEIGETALRFGRGMRGPFFGNRLHG